MGGKASENPPRSKCVCSISWAYPILITPKERVPASKKREGGKGPLSATTDYNLQQTRRTAGAQVLKGEDKGVYATRNQLSPSVQKGSGKYLLRLGSARKRGRGMEGTGCGDSSPPANILEVIWESQFPPARPEIRKGCTDPSLWPGVFPKINPTPIRRPGRKIQRSTKRSRVRWA